MLRCLYNFGFKVPTYLIQNDHELSFFLNGEDACTLPIYLSTSYKPVHGSNSGLGSDLNHNFSFQSSFSYNLAQNIQSSPPPITSNHHSSFQPNYPSHNDLYRHVKMSISLS